MNGASDRSFILQYKHELQFSEILRALQLHWGSRYNKNTRLFNPEGVEYENNDLSYVKDNDNIYASKGEDFDPNSGFCEYEIIREIGEGGFGRVLLAIHKNTHESVAIKVMKADKITSAQSIDQIFREVENLKAVRHPNIVKIHNCYALQGMQIVMIMEYLEGGQLLDYLNKKGKLGLGEALLFFKQIVSAINYCHSKNIVHRDLKLENVLLKNSNSTQIKVADFGIAGIADRANPNIDSGTLKYMAPQILSGLEKDNSPAADVWAMGCIFYYMLFGKLPFVGKTGFQTKQLILKGTYTLANNIQIGPAAQRLLSKMLEKNHKIRIKTDLICDQLYKMENNINYNTSEEPCFTCSTTTPLKKDQPNPQMQVMPAIKIRKEIRYRHLRPLITFHPQRPQRQSRVDIEKILLSVELPKKYIIRKSQKVKRLDLSGERRNSLGQHSLSFRNGVVATPAQVSRMNSRELIYSLKHRRQ